ncbi:MAG TPA: HlyD family efflux transporter periplasmic adaptor subunit [Candidatus Binataceae bacterium]|jgi:multidrug efflux system membrane fusion protein|nr:HlyD family efflux transporter periplasmic adaptor subunit [Candidatus Binataceae bacterium]
MDNLLQPDLKSPPKTVSPREVRRGHPVLRVMGRILGISIVLVTLALGVYVARLYYLFPQTDDAYVRANIVHIAPHVSGPIIDLPLQDNQHVRKNDLLFVVDPRPYQAALQMAQARLDLTDLDIKALDNAIDAAKARQAQLEAEAKYDEQYLQRLLPLLKEQFVTADQVYNARTKLAVARAAVENARSEVYKAQNQLGQYGDINARRNAAQAAVYDAKLNVGYCYVRAPFDAYVTNLNIAAGEYANEGKQVLSLVDNRTWYVMANFRENFLSRIEPGMTAQVFLIGYRNHRFRGVVQGVGWALFQENGATVDGLARTAPTLNWVRLSQRFPVRITLKDRDPKHPFRMGETAVVTIQGFK